MNIEEAITTAIVYEKEIRNAYKEAAEETPNPTGKRILNLMAKEEQNHVDYLEKKLEEWKSDGKIVVDKLETLLPETGKIQNAIKDIKKDINKSTEQKELDLLHKLYDAEERTSNYYQKLVQELDGNAQAMFQQFLKIEEGHKEVVLAEIDCLNGAGFWFDMREFSLEM